MEILFRSVIGFLILAAFPNLVIAQTSPKVEEMSIDQKVGQLFLIGFPQQRVDAQLEDFVKKYKISSFILFKRNISSLSQVAKMNSQLQSLATGATHSLPIIAVDQEGGQVARVPTKPPIPNAMSVGQTQNAELAYSLGQETAKIIRTLGFNMNLAPVLDVSSPKSESFIGQRSFGSDADKVGAIGYALSKGLLEEAVIPTAKHFPGVGSVTGDPHKKAVENDVTADDLYGRDIKPFSEFAKLGPHTAIMLSHLSYPSLDETNTPATLSAPIIKDILRGKIGYKGLIITDDIQMKGLTSVASPHDAALAALKAGADVIMMTWSFKDQAKAIERVILAVKNGELSEEDLNEKVSRILATKEYLSKNTPKLGEIENPKVKMLSTRKLREIESRILDFNIKVALRKAAEIERTPSSTKKGGADTLACVFSPAKDFVSSFKKSGVKYKALTTTPKTKPALLASYLDKNACSYGVFVIYGPKTARILETFSNKLSEKILVINLSSPSLVQNPDRFINVVNLYFPHPEAGRRVAENLSALARRSSPRQFAHAELE